MNEIMQVFGGEAKSVLRKIKLNTGHPPLVYFSSNTFSLNYYFIAQLFYLSQLYKTEEVNLVIMLNDLSRRNPLSGETDSTHKTIAKNSDVYKILDHFGVPCKNIVIHKLSEGWHNYLQTNEKAHFDFLHNLVFFDKKLAEVPEEERKLDFLEKNASYEIHYILQKYADFLISANYEKIFPNDFHNEVDIQVTSNFSYPLLERIRKDLIKRKNFYQRLPQVYSTPKLPFFGKSKMIHHEHIVPNIEMSMSEINRAVNIYNLDKLQIYKIYSNFFDYALPDKSKLKSLLRMSLHEQRVLLAEDLYHWLKSIKQILNAPQKDLLVISKNSTDSSELLSLFRSKLTFEILSLCNGENRVIDISRKLNKHQPNISKVISKLKRYEIIELNQENKLIKVVNHVQIII